MTTDDPISLWRDMPSFYEEIIDRHGANLQPMIALVRRIAASSWARELFPSTSMEALGLSKHRSYAERIRNRSVWFEYMENSEMFRVTFQEGRGSSPPPSVDVPSVDDAMWRRIATWLDLH